MRVRGPIARADLTGLTGRVCALSRAWEGGTIDCEVVGVAADAVALEALARLALVARRRGCRVRLLGAAPELLEVVALSGLGDVFVA